MAVLHHIVDHSTPLNTSEVWRAAFFHTLTVTSAEVIEKRSPDG